MEHLLDEVISNASVTLGLGRANIAVQDGEVTLIISLGALETLVQSVQANLPELRAKIKKAKMGVENATE